MMKTDLASFWSDSLSKSWAAYNDKVEVEEDGTIPKDVKPLCVSCRHFVIEDDTGEAWCILGNDVPRRQCDDYEEKGGSKKVIKFGKKKK